MKGQPPTGPRPPAGPPRRAAPRRRTGRLEGRPPSLPGNLTIERVGAREVHVSGGESPHTAEHPFVIDLDGVRDTPHVTDWMSRIALRGWGATPVDLLTLARLLLDALGEHQEPPVGD